MSEQTRGAGTTQMQAAMTARERRHALLWIALRRVNPGTGSAPEFLRRRDWSELGMDLHRLRTPYVIVGAVAARLYMPERATNDIDLLVRAADAAAIETELTAHGLSMIARLAIGGSSWQTGHDGLVEVIEGSAPWVDDAVANPNRSPDGLPVIRLPYLVLMKLGAARAVDMGDLARMLGLATEDERDEIRAVVARHQPEDSEDLESLIYLGQLEMRDVR